MASTFAAPKTVKPLEDPLEYLPCSRIVEHKRGEIIYGPGEKPRNLYLIMTGKVKVNRIADDGDQALVDIYQVDDIFGESALVDSTQLSERAVTIERTKLMAWTSSEIEDAIMKRPMLAFALLQVMSRRLADFTVRIQGFSSENIRSRLARALVHFSEKFGIPEDDGGVQMMPFSHELLAQYVGTSREIVTHYMNELRREGYVQYSRKNIVLHCDALREWLRQNA